MRVGRSAWELEIDPKRFREEINNDIENIRNKLSEKKNSGAPKTSQIRPHNVPKAVFGSKNRANEAQERSKTNLEALPSRSRSPKARPRDPEESPKEAR